MSTKRIIIAVFGALVLGFIGFNFENWLAGHGWNDLITDFEKEVKQVEWSWSAIWNGVNAFMISDFAIGLAIGGLVFAFWDPVARYGESLLGLSSSTPANETELLRQQRLAKKEDRVGRELDEQQKVEAARHKLDDLFAEGVKLRNRLIPAIENYDNNNARSEMRRWSNKVVRTMTDAKVKLGARSRFRTFNRFDPEYTEAEGKSPAQHTVEAIYNEKLERLRAAIDSFD